MPSSSIAVYPGTFDIVTNGHLDIIRRCAARFAEVVVAVASNDRKTPLFSVEERLDALRKVCASFSNVRVDALDGLTVDYVQRIGAEVIIRGLRFVSDFEFELQMALMNRSMAPEIETIFLAPSAEFSFLSSSLVREVASRGRDVSMYVPPVMNEILKQKLSANRQ